MLLFLILKLFKYADYKPIFHIFICTGQFSLKFHHPPRRLLWITMTTSLKPGSAP